MAGTERAKGNLAGGEPRERHKGQTYLKFCLQSNSAGVFVVFIRVTMFITLYMVGCFCLFV